MLELRDVNVSFRSERQDTLLRTKRQQVLYHVSLTVPEGCCLGVLGESGSGKSTAGRVLCGLLKPDKGQVLFRGQDIYRTKSGRRALQESISVVFQDYTTSANPRFHVRDIIAEGLMVYQRRTGKRLDISEEVTALLEQVGLDGSYASRYAHQLSGGQLQRVCIARAIACRPKVILLDEAISSLDAHTQVQIMDLLVELKDRYGLTYVFITHDLTAITYLCDRVLFLYQGQITEQCEVAEIAGVQDSYAQKLLSSIIDFEEVS